MIVAAAEPPSASPWVWRAFASVEKATRKLAKTPLTTSNSTAAAATAQSTPSLLVRLAELAFIARVKIVTVRTCEQGG